jgi:hypothetical protein
MKGSWFYDALGIANTKEIFLESIPDILGSISGQ